MKGAVIKIDLSKAYDRFYWLYLRMLLTHLGFGIDFIRWIMSCITMVYFAVLINGSTSSFFQAGGGLQQGKAIFQNQGDHWAPGKSKIATIGHLAGRRALSKLDL